MKLDPGMHIDMHLVSFGKSGVTVKVDHINVSVARSFDAMYTNKLVPPIGLFELVRVLDSLILCRNLRKLDICVFCFPRMPESIDPGVLPNLFSMSIVLMELCQRDMEIIGWFQKLCFLYLVVRRVLSSIISISSGDGLFQNLKYFHARFSLPMFVKQGAMPSLEHIELLISLRNVNIDNLDLVSGLGNLTSLQLCTVNISCTDCCAAEVEEVEDMVRHAVGSNPNRPTLKIVRTVEEKMVNDSGLLGPQRRRVCTCCPVFTITCLSVSLIPSKINNSGQDSGDEPVVNWNFIKQCI
jgi:hypothetical protein